MKSIKCIIIVISAVWNMSVSGQVIKGTYAIKSCETAKLLRPKDANNADGTPIVLYNPVNWKCMTWNFINVKDNIYYLQNLFTNKTFQAKGGAKENAVLEQQPLNKSLQNQQWEFLSAPGSKYLIRLKCTEFYLTASESSVFLKSKTDGNTQLWEIYLQDPEY